MNREVFQGSKFIAIGIVMLVLIFITYIYLSSDFPLFFLLIFYVVGIIIVVYQFKTKLVVEGEVLRYETLFGGEEIELKNVSRIVTREERVRSTHHGEDTVPGSVTIEKKGFNITLSEGQEDIETARKVYILDDVGSTYFSIPARMIKFKQRARFKNAVQTINPKIDVF